MEQKRTINTTLAIIRKDDKVLLGTKKRGFCAGTINAFGGKQDAGETMEQAMVRETFEEVGITPTEYDLTAFIKFDTDYKGERVYIDMYVYNVTAFEGKEMETEEMLPQWFDINNIPYDKMLSDDRLWFPDVLSGKCIVGNVVFGENMTKPVCDFKVVSKDELSQKELAI